MSDVNEKEMAVACEIERIKRDRVTGKMTLDFKEGVLMGGRVESSFIRVQGLQKQA